VVIKAAAADSGRGAADKMRAADRRA